jgi:cell division protein FtsW
MMMKVAVTILIACVGALLALGMVMLYSSSMAQAGARYLVMQAIWCVLGFCACLVAASCDYRHLKRWWWLLFALAVLLLVLVLVPRVGVVRGGARRWFSFGGISFQPSEAAKLALVVALAWYGERFQRKMGTWIRGIVVPGLLIALILGLIFKEPDVGNALVLGVVGGIVLLLAGARFAYLLPPVVAGLLAVGTFIYFNPMRSDRVYAWLHLEETKQGKGLQAYQAMVALGSGGVTGNGLGDSRQKLGFLPEHHTDFIYAIIGEELGLAATLSVVFAFVTVVVCGLFISRRSCDTFGFLLGSGLTCLIGLQAWVNIGVVTSALPNKGLPLPFISYGGSNLLMMLTAVGLLLSIARRARFDETPGNGLADAEILPCRRSQNPFQNTDAPHHSSAE